jgi:hypothetical protein
MHGIKLRLVSNTSSENAKKPVRKVHLLLRFQAADFWFKQGTSVLPKYID